MTLYSKAILICFLSIYQKLCNSKFIQILFLDGDYLLDVKYVLHSPRICAKSGIESTKDHIKSDGTLKAHLGRLNVIYLHRFGMDILVK